MRIFNKIVCLFLFGCAFVFVLAKQIAQSELFAQFVQERLIYQKIDREKMVVQFQNFDISIIPLRTTVTKINLTLLQENIKATFDTVSFRVDFSDLFLNKFTISELRTDGGKISMGKRNEKKMETNHSMVGESVDDIIKIIEDLPFEVDRVSINDASLEEERLKGHLETMEMSYEKGQRRIDINLQGKDFKLKKNDRWRKNIDGIRIVARAEGKEIIFRDILVNFGGNNISTKGIFIIKTNAYEGDIQTRILLKDFKEYIPEKRFHFIEDGIFTFEGKIRLKNTLSFNGKTHIENFRSQHGSFEKMESTISINNNILKLQGTTIKTVSGTISVEDELQFNLKNKIHNSIDIPVRLDKVRTREILAFLGDKLKPLDSFLTGNLRLYLENNILRFELEDQFKMFDTRLVFNNQSPVLFFKNLILEKTRFDHNLETGVFSIHSDIALGNSILRARGYIGKSNVDIGFQDGGVDFNVVDHIAGVKVGGTSRLDFKVEGPIGNVKIYASGASSNLFVERYPLGDVQLDIVYSIKSKVLKVNTLKSDSLEFRFSTSGHFDFSDNPKNNMEIEITVDRMNYTKMQKILESHLPKKIAKIDRLNFISSGTVSLKLNFKKGIDQIKANFSFNSITYFNEVLSSARFEFLIDQEKLSFNNFYLKKDEGEVTGHYSYAKSNQYFEYDFKVKEINIDSFYFYRWMNMGLRGKIDGSFYGSGTLNDFSTRALVRLMDSYIGNKKISPPTLTVYGNKNDLSLSWSILDGKVEGSSLLVLKDNSRPSNIKLDIKLDDITPLLAILSDHNMRSDITGNLYGKIDSSFNLEDISNLNLGISIENFHLDYGSGSIALVRDKNEIKISQGKVDSWNMNFTGKNSFLTSNAEGDLNSGFKIQNNYNFDPGVLKVFFQNLSDAKGTIRGETNILGSSKKISMYSVFSGKNISFSHQNIPGIFEGIDLEVVSDNEKIIIKKMNGRYGRGNFDIKGDIKLSFPYPRTNINVNFESINYAILSRSNLIASGKINLVGDAPPYLLSGRIVVDRVLFSDSLADLAREVNSSYAYSKYLPKRGTGVVEELINFDLDINSSNSIAIKTGIIDAVLSSNLSLRGNLKNPLVTGRASVAPRISKISFKGQEFSLDSGRIDFRDSNTKEAPFIQAEANSNIDKYKIFLSIIGNADNLKLNLKSEPVLAQKDIFSLITFGYTSDISNNLDEDQRQFLTTMSLGSLLIDQLQIGKDLSGKLGVRFSVAQEFDDNEERLIENRASDTGAVRRLRSLTKLKLESNVGDKTSVSVASSVGAENEQSQELKIDYNINDSVSIQGVYESITGENKAQETDSLGGDFKFRWIFGD